MLESNAFRFTYFAVAFLIGVLLTGIVSRVDLNNDEIESGYSAIAKTELQQNLVAEVEVGVEVAADEVEFKGVKELYDDDYSFWEHENLIDLHETEGLFRQSEVIAKSGETWMTMFKKGNKFRLVPSIAKVKELESVSYPGDENDVRLTFSSPGSPVLALRNIKGLKNGAIVTSYLRPKQKEIDARQLPIGYIKTGYERDLKLGEKWFVLRVSEGLTIKGDKVGVLVLEHEGRSQIIDRAYIEAGTAHFGTLYWAGDIDGDNMIDLYFDDFNEKGSFLTTLYLSSAAKKGDLVGAVASFGTAGC